MKIRKWLWCPRCGVHCWHKLIKLRWKCEDCQIENFNHERAFAVTEDEFLSYIREHVGSAGSDDYWKKKYQVIKDKKRQDIVKEVPYMAPGAVADDYNRGKK